MDAKEWVKTDEHLPELLRGAYLSSYLFQCIDLLVEEKIKESKQLDCFGLPNSVAAHIYTVDFFLKFMGLFGYTLQKEHRSDVVFLDLEKTIDDFRKEQIEKYLPSLPSQEGEG